MFAIASACLLAIPIDGAITVRVDLIEVNHVGDRGDEFDRLVQVIFWDFARGEPEWRVVAWRHEKQITPSQVQKRGLEYHLVWFDKQIGRTVHIVSTAFKETFTTYDPEHLNRKEWVVEKRRGIK